MSRLTGLAHFPEICDVYRNNSLLLIRLHEGFFLAHLSEPARLGEICEVDCQISPIGPVKRADSLLFLPYKHNIFSPRVSSAQSLCYK